MFTCRQYRIRVCYVIAPAGIATSLLRHFTKCTPRNHLHTPNPLADPVRHQVTSAGSTYGVCKMVAHEPSRNHQQHPCGPLLSWSVGHRGLVGPQQRERGWSRAGNDDAQRLQSSRCLVLIHNPRTEANELELDATLHRAQRVNECSPGFLWRLYRLRAATAGNVPVSIRDGCVGEKTRCRLCLLHFFYSPKKTAQPFIYSLG